MAVERMTKRTIWTFDCPICDYRKVYHKDPPKELVCPACHGGGHTEWMTPKEESWTGKDRFDV